MAYHYDLIVIGGGAAGLTASGIGTNLGAKTVMIERAQLGGDCTWTGCVPSKTLLKAAKVAHHIRYASRYGLTDHPLTIDFPRLIAHVHQTRQAVYEDADAPAIYEAMGVTVRQGQARFLDAHTVEVVGAHGTEHLSGRYVIVAAGGRAAMPPIEGIADVPYLTNEDLFEVEALPEQLAIVGGGPIGTEMAQAFCRLGTQVTVLQRGGRILPKDDLELTGLLQETLKQEGVTYLMHADVRRVMRHSGRIYLEAPGQGRSETVEAGALLARRAAGLIYKL